MSDPAIQQILAYLREHAGAYPPEELRAQLLAAGYREADVDAAFARLAAQPPATGETILAPPARPPATDATIALPLPGAQDDAQLGRAIAYVEQHRAAYDERALRGALVQSGYPAGVVDEALRRAAPARQQGRPRAWPVGLLVAALNYGLIGIVAFAEVILSGDLTVSLLFVAALLLGELIAWLALRRGPRERLGRILLFGAIFTVAGVLLGGALAALLVGICLAIIYGAGV